jgi:superfamily I DNA/RNA helicase
MPAGATLYEIDQKSAQLRAVGMVGPTSHYEWTEEQQHLAEQAKAGLIRHEFGVFVRPAAVLNRAKAAVKEVGLPFKILDENVETSSGHVSICTMHIAKGLEFRAVAVMACDDEIIPLQERIETVGDDADLQEVYDTERHLLYVACTRARDHILMTVWHPVSEFLDDFVKGDEGRGGNG